MNMDARLDAVIDGAIAERRIVGTTVMIAKKGETVYARAAGHADRETGKPAAIDTIYRLASVTKPIVAATALALVDKRQLDLNGAVSDHLPYFRPKTIDGNEPRITIRHLLTHTAGLGYNPTPPGAFPEDVRVSTGLLNTDLGFEENFTRLAAIPLDYEPGTKWAYSMAIDVLGAVVAAVAGSSLEEAVVKHVAGPLDMTDTRFHATDPIRLSVPYADARPEPVPMTDPHVVENGAEKLYFSPGRIFNPKAFQSGGAGMAGTAPDILIFLNAIASGGSPILSGDITAQAMCNQIGTVERRPQDAGRRFGFFGAVLDDPELADSPSPAGTVSWGGVYGHSWFIDPVNGIVAVFMSNTAVEGCVGAYPSDLARAVYG